MSTLTVRGVRVRFLVLVALRWLPTGLFIPVFVLLPLERGIGLAELGLAFAAQGIVVMLLELPTGGLADAAGRRPTLLLAAGFGLASMAWFLVADSVAALVGVFVLQGVYRALDSGPLDAWYVDTTHMVEPDADIDGGLAASAVVVGLAIAGGALGAGGLVALDPVPGVDALAVPILVGLVLQVAGVVGVLTLMPEPRSAEGAGTAIRAALDAPRTVAAGLRLVRGSRVLAALVAVELFWGFGMVTFEALPPVRLEELLGDADAAAAITGPAGSAAWAASAAGAAVVTLLSRRIGTAPTAALLRVVQGITVVAMGMAGGVAGLLVAYLACYATHGASNPPHLTLLHAEATREVRATVLSINSMVSHPAGALGTVALTALAASAGTPAAFVVGGLVIAVAAPLYLPAWRQERARRTASDGPAVVPVAGA